MLRSRWFLPLAIAGVAVIVLLDQVSKHWMTSNLQLGERMEILPVLSWVLLHNDGVAFSMFDDAGPWLRWAVSLLALCFSGYLLWEVRRLVVREWPLVIAYTLIAGGALGNMIDRVRLGYVVDFVLTHWESYRFAVFNVADAAISVGAALWICLLFMGYGAPVDDDADQTTSAKGERR